MEKVTECIQNDSPAPNCIIVTTTSQYTYIPSIPQITLPDFLTSDGNQKYYILRAIRQFQFAYNSFYIAANLSLEESILPAEDKKRLVFLGCFQKNRKGNKIYIFRYDSCPLTEKKYIRHEHVPDSRQNLIKNGGFEQQYKMGQHSYYEQIASSSKKGAIPEGYCFPEAWDITWGFGFDKDNHVAVYSKNNNPINGNYSLFVKCNKKVSFQSTSRFPAGKYIFQCDLRASRPSSFGLRLNLRDAKNNFYGSRDIKEINLDQTNVIYHYEITLTENMTYPFDHFYLYFAIFDKSEIEIDNVLLVKSE